jgi:hypothetical protein
LQAAVVAMAFARQIFAVGSHRPMEHCESDVHAAPGCKMGMHVFVAVRSHIPVESHIAAAVHGVPTGPAWAHVPAAMPLPTQ